VGDVAAYGGGLVADPAAEPLAEDLRDAREAQRLRACEVIGPAGVDSRRREAGGGDLADVADVDEAARLAPAGT
jgi:hypothetical protein